MTVTEEMNGKFTSQRADLLSVTNKRGPSHKDLVHAFLGIPHYTIS